MNIFEALRQSHDIQRQLCDQLIATQGASTEREQLFKTLTRELHAHARAEERYFYIPLMENDQGVDLSRHAIAEHHEMDELIEQVAAADPATASWLVYAKQLSTLVHHHLKEEEQRFFQMAGKILSQPQKEQLTKGYLEDYQAGLEEY